MKSSDGDFVERDFYVKLSENATVYSFRNILIRRRDKLVEELDQELSMMCEVME